METKDPKVETPLKPVVSTYKKQNSFDNFRSKSQSSLEEQKKRAVRVLESYFQNFDEKDKYHHVLSLAQKELRASEKPSFQLNQYSSDELALLSDESVPRYLFHRYRYERYPSQYLLDDYPPYLQIEPSSICNYRCVFCYQTDKDFTSKQSGHMGTMSFETFKVIVDQIVGHVDFISLASRGEPLVCREIDKILQYTEGKFLGLKINTNASLMNEKLAHMILSSGISTVVFSADAAKEPLYGQLRVNGNLDRVTKNIELFQDIRSKHYGSKPMITRVSGVKLNDTQDMGEMDEYWGGLVDQIAFVNYNPWENIYATQPKEMLTPCTDLWRRMFIWHDGRVNPCDTDFKSHLCVGNILETPFTELWASERYQDLRQAHKNKMRNIAEPCRRCSVI